MDQEQRQQELLKQMLQQANYDPISGSPQGLGQALGPALAQLQQLEAQKHYQQQQAVWPNQMPQFPSVESVEKRISGVKEQIKQASVLLETLENIHAVLVKHPDLERIVSTFARLGQL